MEHLDLQRSLQAELRAKQAIEEELTKTREAYLTTQGRYKNAEIRVRLRGIIHCKWIERI